MPKPLTRPQPSSSVINFLEPHVGAAALAIPEKNFSPMLATPIVEQLPPREEETVSSIPKRSVLRQFKLPQEADDTLQRLVQIYSDAAGVDLKMTEVLCALLKGAEGALSQIEYESTKMGSLKRPKNDRLNERRKEEFIKEIARRFVAGMRASSAMG